MHKHELHTRTIHSRTHQHETSRTNLQIPPRAVSTSREATYSRTHKLYTQTSHTNCVLAHTPKHNLTHEHTTTSSCCFCLSRGMYSRTHELHTRTSHTNCVLAHTPKHNFTHEHTNTSSCCFCLSRALSSFSALVMSRLYLCVVSVEEVRLWVCLAFFAEACDVWVCACVCVRLHACVCVCVCVCHVCIRVCGVRGRGGSGVQTLVHVECLLFIPYIYMYRYISC